MLKTFDWRARGRRPVRVCGRASGGKRGSKTGVAAAGARADTAISWPNLDCPSARSTELAPDGAYLSSSNMPATHNPRPPPGLVVDWPIIDMQPGMIRYRGYAIET